MVRKFVLLSILSCALAICGNIYAEDEVLDVYDIATSTLNEHKVDYDTNVQWPSFTGNETEVLYSPHVVFGDDDRTLVQTTTSFPYSPIGLVIATYPNGKSFRGTGFMVSENVFITNAHVVFNSSRGGYATQIVFTPGKNNSSNPFGTATAATVVAPKKYRENESDHDYDYAAVKLNRNIGEDCGYFGYKADANIAGRNVWITGYPADYQNYCMYRCKGVIMSREGRKLKYQIDTYGGNSGSPIYRTYTDLGYTVIGIHWGGSESDSNYGVGFTNPIMNYIADKL